MERSRLALLPDEIYRMIYKRVFEETLHVINFMGDPMRVFRRKERKQGWKQWWRKKYPKMIYSDGLIHCQIYTEPSDQTSYFYKPSKMWWSDDEGIALVSCDTHIDDYHGDLRRKNRYTEFCTPLLHYEIDSRPSCPRAYRKAMYYLRFDIEGDTESVEDYCFSEDE